MNAEGIFRNKLSQLWEDYEPRREQVEMANLIEESFAKGKNAAIEAGTGVGKSLAYLIPAAMFAIENETTVVLSTETKALQDQLIQKDIPIVEKALGVTLRATVALGASNYLCKRKYSKVMDRGEFGAEMEEHLPSFLSWERNTSSGIRSEYQGFVSSSFWSSVSRDPENCLGRNCPNFSHSYYFLEKEKWKKSQLLIVNHHLLASHLAGDFKILPPFSQLVIDEAHVFPEILGKAFSSEFRYETILATLTFLYSPEKKGGIVPKLKNSSILYKNVENTIHALRNYFSKLMGDLPLNLQYATRHTERLRLDEGEFEDSIAELVENLAPNLEAYKKESDDEEEKEIAIGLELSISNLKKAAAFSEDFRTKKHQHLVFWVDPPPVQSKDPFYILNSQPKNTDEIIDQTLFPNLDSVVFTSATLSPTPGNFTYFKKEIGNSEITTKTLASPFNYAKQAVLFVPKQIADPVSDPKKNLIDLSYFVKRLIHLTEGDAFVLFTSNKLMNDLYEMLVDTLEYPIFSQSILGPIGAKREFLETKHSVLFGVSSFWQGVDIKGDRLKNVIITKLPFQVPTEPVLQAKMEDMERQGKSPFWEMQVPKTCLLLRQGFGRLIRSGTDTGVVSILDPRVHTKSYGKNVLQSLPRGTPLTTEFSELERKFQQMPKSIL